VVGKRIETVASEDGDSYNPVVSVTFEIDGERYFVDTYDIQVYSFAGDRGAEGAAGARQEVERAWWPPRPPAYSSDRSDAEAVLDRYETGEPCLCWYDPADPNRAVIQRGYSWWIWPFLVIPVAFIGVGGGGLVYSLRHWGKSRERSTADDQTARFDVFNGPPRSADDYPGVPDDADIVNSPGTTLKYRLPISTSTGWKLLGSLVLCLLWNATVAVFVVMAVGDLIRGKSGWLLVLFLVPFVLVGLWTVYFFFRQLFRCTRSGATRLEIDDHPMRPGGEYEVLLTQAGRLSVKRLEMLLTCHEEATYQQGTDTRRESHCAFRQRIFLGEGFEIGLDGPLEVRRRFQLPSTAMHSLKTSHNEIAWKLVVRGEVAGRPEIERSFSVIVYPPLCQPNGDPP